MAEQHTQNTQRNSFEFNRPRADTSSGSPEQPFKPNTAEQRPAQPPTAPRTEPQAEIEAEDNGTDTGRSRGAGKALSKGSVRRIAAKVIEVSESDHRTVEVAAGLLGSKTDPVDLTVAIMTADRSAATPIKDIQSTLEAAAEDQISAVLGLNAASRTQLKTMWSTLAAVNNSSATMPSNERQALTSLFNQITSLTPEQEDLLTSAADLLRRA